MVKGRVASENLPILPGVCSFHWIRYDWGQPILFMLHALFPPMESEQMSCYWWGSCVMKE